MNHFCTMGIVLSFVGMSSPAVSFAACAGETRTLKLEPIAATTIDGTVLNRCNASLLTVGNWGGNKIMLMSFSPEGLPAGTCVNKATLHLHVKKPVGDSPGKLTPFVAKPWECTDNSVTLTHKGDSVLLKEGANPVNVTSVMADLQAERTDTNWNIALKGDDESRYFYNVSSPLHPEATQRPWLEVEITSP